MCPVLILILLSGFNTCSGDEESMNPSINEIDVEPVGQSVASNVTAMIASTRSLPLVTSAHHRVCILNTDCHLDLNERCINDASLAYTICGCGHAFVRNSENNVCELKRGIRLMIRFNTLPFLPEYFRNNTPSFIRMRELAEITVKSIISGSKSLSECVKQIDVFSFRSSDGSSSSNSLNHSKNALEAEVLIYITNSLFKSIKSKQTSLALVFIKEISVSVHEFNRSKFHTNPEYDMTVTEIEADINPCQISELNYCSPSASHCFFSSKDNNFRCECKDRFTDISPHPLFTGELCSLECPDDYCSNEGHCHVDRQSMQLYCTCNHWNVGARCQYDGVIVISVLGLIVLLLLLVVACTASAFCSKSGSRKRSSDESLHRVIRSSSTMDSNNLQAKQSLLSSSCNEDQHVRPFRITIDNLNYGSSGQDHAAPLVQFSPTSIVAPALNPHRLTSCSTSPVPSPRPSLTATAVQTDQFSELRHLSASSLEVALDRPARGSGLRAPAIDRSTESRPGHKAMDRSIESSGGISWC